MTTKQTTHLQDDADDEEEQLVVTLVSSLGRVREAER